MLIANAMACSRITPILNPDGTHARKWPCDDFLSMTVGKISYAAQATVQESEGLTAMNTL